MSTPRVLLRKALPGFSRPSSRTEAVSTRYTCFDRKGETYIELFKETKKYSITRLSDLERQFLY